MKNNNKLRVTSAFLMSLMFAQALIPAQASALSVNTSADATLDAEVGMDIGSGVRSTTTTTVESGSETSTGSESDMFFKVNALGVAVISSGQVKAASDLEVFSQNASVKNSQVEAVEINANSNEELVVKIKYKHHGKLFGFMPVTVRSTTVVEADGGSEPKVKSNLSWWSFLVADKDYSKAELESKIKNNQVIKANARADASAEAKARVAEAVIAEISAYASANASLNS